MKNEHLLHEEIQSEFAELSKLAVGSDEYKIAVDGVTKLMDRAIEIDKLNIEYEEKKAARENENDFKIQQLNDEKKDRLIKNLLTGLGIAIPSVITVWGTLKSLKFEEEGTVTTIVGRGFINKLLPKK